MISVLFYVSCTGLLFTFSLLAPILVGFLVGETAIAYRFFFYLLGGFFLFGVPAVSAVGRLSQMNRRDNIILVGLIWLFLPILISFPLYDMSDLSFIDSLFETVTSLTTTGSSVILHIEDWPHTLVFWISLLQWLGGALAILTLYAIIAPLGIGGLSLGHGMGTMFLGDTRMTTLLVRFFWIYIGLTALAFLSFMVMGIRSFYAVCLAMAAVSTGGFLPFDDNLDTIIGNGGLFIFACFLSLGATSIFWHFLLTSGGSFRFKDHKESWIILSTIAVLASLFLVLLFVIEGTTNLLHTFLEGVFNAASLVSTFGVESHHGVLSLVPLPFVLFIIFAGGGVFSTSGGIKYSRIGAMFAQTWNELDRLIHPSNIRLSGAGDRSHSFENMQSILSFFVIAILTISFGTLFVSYSTPSFEASFTAVMSSFSTAGPVYSTAWGDNWPPYAEFTSFSKLILLFLMILGRLEVLVVIAFFSLFSRQSN